MRYWTLFTLKITTRVGLCMALLLWWYSQSTVLVVSTPIVPRGLGATTYPFGVIVYQLEKTTAARWSFFRRELVDPDEFWMSATRFLQQIEVPLLESSG